MQSPIFIKAGVITGFALLLSGFVAYRSGAFDKYIDKTTAVPDSPVVTPANNVPRGMSYSSKSGAVFPPETTAAKTASQDTSKKKQQIQKPHTMMGSSKSGGVFMGSFKPQRQDTSKKQQQQKQNTNNNNYNIPDNYNAPANNANQGSSGNKNSMMGSSKSGAIFYPREDTSKPKQNNNPPK